MTSGEMEGEPFIDWTGLRPSERDNFQMYVSAVHVGVGIGISILSYPGDLLSWNEGIGILLPSLIALTGLAYLLPTGINWYRDEFLPFVNRFIEIPKTESDHFLRYQRIMRFAVLVSGYLDTVVCQAVYTWINAVFPPIGVNLNPALDTEGGLIAGVVVLFFILWFIFMAFFELILTSVYPDVLRLARLDNSITEATKKTADEQEDK
ncbi:MAG: hypothetical protein EAX87_08390 [Candidatus Thorarchaeota archaeon]|nr:hypothetical protein [Candidatus Thorarchaeota archaeon]